MKFCEIEPKNHEQTSLARILIKPSKEVVVVTGKAGTGKSLIIGAYIAENLLGKNSTFDRVIMTKPMEIVGDSKYFGTVPGDENDKLKPFLLNIEYLYKKILDQSYRVRSKELMDKTNFVPIELMRGLSIPPRTIVWVDEAQNLSEHMINTLGTRIEKGSRLIISGDLNQVDNNSKNFKSGLQKVIESEYFKKSKIADSVHLSKVERGPIAELFTNIFESE